MITRHQLMACKLMYAECAVDLSQYYNYIRIYSYFSANLVNCYLNYSWLPNK